MRRSSSDLRRPRDRMSLLACGLLDDANGALSAKRSDVLAVDGHQHFWDPATLPLPWMTAAQAVTDRADERLDELAAEPKLRGIRHLIHDEEDPHWILQSSVLESLELLEQRGLIIELPAVFPRHLGDVPELARAFPQLRIVIDHLGKPPLGRDIFGRWATELATAAENPNVAAKISGLNTATTAHDWDAAALRPAVQVAVEAFGPDRLLCGSDWPVALLNGDYDRVWRETRRVVELVAPANAEAVLAGTARRLYELDRVPVHVQAKDEDGAD